MTTKGNRYNNEFKSDIIRLIREEWQFVNKVAKDFGVNDRIIRNWLKEYKILKIPATNSIILQFIEVII